jgi:hypothetical protein
MPYSRTIVVIGAAVVLSAASVSIFLIRTPARACNPTWKVTRLQAGRESQTVFIDGPLSGDPGEFFSDQPAPGTASYLIEPLESPHANAGNSLFITTQLQPGNRAAVEFLLLLPAAALFVCLCRNLIGLQPFGTFGPALLGLALRESRPAWGIGIVVVVLAAGSMMRRALERFHLLQVPRTALLLTFVVLILLVCIFAADAGGIAGAGVVTLLPLVILTGMIERFWTMEEEDGSAAAFRTQLTTLGIAGIVALLASVPAVPRFLMRHPESLGLVMAALLVLGRYTGLRLIEAYRFRALAAVPTQKIHQ